MSTERNTQNKFNPRMSTPWGSINTWHKLADGVYSVDTPGHGGLWLSDERVAALPEHYEPWTGTRRWAEEDEDAAQVLQYLGLLSLVDAPLHLEVTKADIEKGRESRQGLYREPWKFQPDNEDTGLYGGAIAEAYQRQTGDTYQCMVCSHYLSPYPGGFKLADISEDGRKWQASFDKGHVVAPITLILEPYRVLEKVTFVHHLKDGSARTDRVSGYLLESIKEGSMSSLFMYQSLDIKADVVKVTHEDQVIWERKDAVAVTIYSFDVFMKPKQEKVSMIYGGMDAAKQYAVEMTKQVGFKAQEAWVMSDKTYFKRDYRTHQGALRTVTLESQ